MANLKECKGCGKQKETTEFSKCKSEKDSLQRKCKDCNSKDNHKFRTEIDPKHHERWQNNNWDKFVEYNKKYYRADKTPTIYSVTSPEGFVYIGHTMTYPKVRINEHRRHYRQYKQGKRNCLPGLHESFDTFGIQNHKFEVVTQIEGIDRKQLEYIERSFISAVKLTGKSLNARYW